MTYDRITQYALDVVNDRTEHRVGELHKLACQRHLDDLDTEDFKFVWDAAAGERICNFAETLTITEGVEPRPLQLQGGQAFDMGCVFGWKHRDDSSLRRFRKSLISKSRQQGKTMQNGVVGSYMMAFSGYKHGKCFTAATKKRQARLVWEEMDKFIRGDADLLEYFEIKDYKNLIYCPSTECSMEALSKEGGLDDGFRGIYISLDEIHQHKDNSIKKALENGQRSIVGITPLLSMITTRGKIPAGFCYEEDMYGQNILRRLAFNEEYFVDIYALDEGDDIWDERNWAKSNPYTVTNPLLWEKFRQDAQEARDKGGMELRDFMVKSLNMWTKNVGDDMFIDPDAWKKCAVDYDVSAMRGRHCFMGVDLSSGGDLTTISFLFTLDDGEFFVHSHSFMPRGRQNEHIATDVAPYDIWEERELITVTGNENDFKNNYDAIIEYTQSFIAEFELHIDAIGYDPHNADGFLGKLEDIAPCIEVKQLAKHLNESTEQVQLSVKEHAFHYNKYDELVSWSFANARLVYNSMKEMKVDKRAGEGNKRIDPVDATIDAYYAMLQVTRSDSEDFDAAMDSYLAEMGW